MEVDAPPSRVSRFICAVSHKERSGGMPEGVGEPSDGPLEGLKGSLEPSFSKVDTVLNRFLRWESILRGIQFRVLGRMKGEKLARREGRMFVLSLLLYIKSAKKSSGGRSRAFLDHLLIIREKKEPVKRGRKERDLKPF